MIKQCVANKNHVARLKVKVTVCTKILCIDSVKPVRVRPIKSLCIVGFENNLAQMIIMTRQCVVNKNHVARSKVKVTVRIYTCAKTSVLLCPTHNFVMHSGI